MTTTRTPLVLLERSAVAEATIGVSPARCPICGGSGMKQGDADLASTPTSPFTALSTAEQLSLFHNCLGLDMETWSGPISCCRVCLTSLGQLVTLLRDLVQLQATIEQVTEFLKSKVNTRRWLTGLRSRDGATHCAQDDGDHIIPQVQEVHKNGEIVGEADTVWSNIEENLVAFNPTTEEDDVKPNVVWFEEIIVDSDDEWVEEQEGPSLKTTGTQYLVAESESSPQPVVEDSITGDVINANKQKMRRLRKDPLERDDDMELRTPTESRGHFENIADNNESPSTSSSCPDRTLITYTNEPHNDADSQFEVQNCPLSFTDIIPVSIYVPNHQMGNQGVSPRYQPYSLSGGGGAQWSRQRMGNVYSRPLVRPTVTPSCPTMSTLIQCPRPPIANQSAAGTGGSALRSRLKVANSSSQSPILPTPTTSPPTIPTPTRSPPVVDISGDGSGPDVISVPVPVPIFSGPRFIPNMEALCRHCGIVTRDLHRCEFCLTRMPEGVKLLKANSQFQSNLYVRFDCHTIQIGSYPNVVPVPLMGVNVTFTKKGISFTLPHWKTWSRGRRNCSIAEEDILLIEIKKNHLLSPSQTISVATGRRGTKRIRKIFGFSRKNSSPNFYYGPMNGTTAQKRIVFHSSRFSSDEAAKALSKIFGHGIVSIKS